MKQEVFLNTIQRGVEAYQTVISQNRFDYVSFDLDCEKLAVPSWVKDDTLPTELDYIFNSLPDNRPCLYYFEIENSDTTTILNKYREFLNEEVQKPKPRRSVALKKNIPMDTSILYVGKVKYDIKGRMMVHLGYYYIEATAGLQLVCWAKDIKLKLKIHIYIFEKEMSNFVTPLELPFARNLRPLFGKH